MTKKEEPSIAALIVETIGVTIVLVTLFGSCAYCFQGPPTINVNITTESLAVPLLEKL